MPVCECVVLSVSPLPERVWVPVRSPEIGGTGNSNDRKHCLCVLDEDINLFRHIVLRCILLLETKYDPYYHNSPLWLGIWCFARVLFMVPTENGLFTVWATHSG